MTRMPLFWAAVSLSAGICSGNFFTYFPVVSLAGILLFFLSDFFFPFLPENRRHFTLLFSFFWAGFISLQWMVFHKSPDDLSRWVDRKITLTASVDEAPAHYPDHTVLILNAETVEESGVRYPASGKLRLSVSDRLDIPAAYGDRLKFPLTPRAPRGFVNFGGWDYRLYLERHHISATASLSRPDGVLVQPGTRGNSLLRKVYAWRQLILEKAVETLHDEPRAIFLAMVIGESGYLTGAVRDAFMASGTTHILSISGSHLALVFLLVFHINRFFLLRLPSRLLLRLGSLILPSNLSMILASPPVLLYGLLAGNQVATNRCMLMILFFLTARLLNREQPLYHSLAFSALFILLSDPLAVFDISFQLSFGSVLSIAVLLGRKEPPEDLTAAPTKKTQPSLPARLYGEIKSVLAVSLATMIGLSPVVAYYFNQFNWAGLIANMVIIPLAGFVLVPVALIASFLSLLTNSPHLLLGDINQFLFSAFYKITQGFASLPLAEIHLPSPSLPSVLIFLAISLYIFLFRPGKVPKIAMIILLLLISVLWFLPPLRTTHRGELQATFLDVGQGDSALIELPDGKTILVDGGMLRHEFDLGRSVVAPYLWNRGVRKIDVVVATHPQADHIGGLVYLLKTFPVGEVWTNGTAKESQIAESFNKTAKEKNILTRVVKAGDHFLWGGADIQVVNPYPDEIEKARSGARENNDGIVIQVRFIDQSVLLTADIENEAEKNVSRDYPRLKSTLLKVPHHGSKGSALPEFLDLVSPEIAVISVGSHNPYHHPNPETIALYQSKKITIYRTDRDGAIQYRTNGYSYDITTARSRLWEPVQFGPGMISKEWQNFRNSLF